MKWDVSSEGLWRPVDAAGLVVFRILFGAILCAKFTGYVVSGILAERYGIPNFHFKYFGFGWVEPPTWIALFAALR